VAGSKQNVDLVLLANRRGVKLIISDIMANLGITEVACVFNWRGKVEGHYIIYGIAIEAFLRPEFDEIFTKSDVTKCDLDKTRSVWPSRF
jgi:hypothetical protein